MTPNILTPNILTDVSQLPSNIPAYLARVIPELSLNGDVILQDSAMSLGNEINLTYQLSGPLTTYAPYNYSVIAGSYLNVPLIAQSVSPNKLQDLQASVEATRAILESDDQTQLDTLTRDQILGDLFYAGGLGYFAQYNGLSHIASLQSQGNHKLEFGYGSYGYEPNVDSFFGIARGIETGGATLNILFANTVERKDGDKDARVQLRFQTGLISSALEHAVPEKMFSDPDSPTDGVSAVKALQLAAQQGQRIYQIDSSNVNAVLSQVSLDASVEDEIRTYVRDNRIAITYSNNISVPGWTGAGYILLDQETGAGSYKISGGGNGGGYAGLFLGLFIASIALLALPALAFLAPLFAILSVFLAVATFFALLDLDGNGFDLRCFSLGVTTGITLGFGRAATGVLATILYAIGIGAFLDSALGTFKKKIDIAVCV